MANNTTKFPKFNERRGLYRVWVPLHDDGKAPLISIWIGYSRTRHRGDALVYSSHRRFSPVARAGQSFAGRLPRRWMSEKTALAKQDRIGFDESQA